MKHTSASRPRLTCRLVRGWSVLAGDPTRGATARHVAACPSCREHFAAVSNLESRLRRADPRPAHALPEGFDQRMSRAINAVMREARAAEPSRSRPVLWWSGLGAAVAALAVAFFLIQPAGHPKSPGETAANSDPTAEPKALVDDSVALAQSLNHRFWNDVAPTATTLVRDNPLQQEVGAVYSDAQSALQFLAMNFLPVAPNDNRAPSTGDTTSG